MKRVLCLLLSLVMLLSMVPVGVMAEQSATEQSGVTSDVGVEGTNSFGNLLAQELEGVQDEADVQANGGYNVVGLDIEGNTATVEYSSIEDANLLVCIYTEDGMQLVASGNTTVSADEDFAQVEIEGEMPQYFLASAYLVDTYDFSPLCEAYDTSMYTQEMQELLASTVEDYDADKVVQLTDSAETNFAVYNDSVVVISGGEGVNTVVSADYENEVYIIENADERVMSLSPGTIFAYQWAENEILIANVASITIDGTTVTITGTELEMKDVFACVKLETDADMGSGEIDTSNISEGFTYAGFYESAPRTKIAWQDDIEVFSDGYHVFEADETIKVGSGVVEIKGGLAIGITGMISYYLTLSKQEIELTLNPVAQLSLNITGKLPRKTFELGDVSLYSGIPFVTLFVRADLVLEADAKIEFTETLTMQIGIGYSTEKGFQNLSTPPKRNASRSIEGSVFFGVSLTCGVGIVDEFCASINITQLMGIKVTGKVTGTSIEGTPGANDAVIHNCVACLKLHFDFVYELSVGGTIVGYNKQMQAVNVTISIGDAYISDKGSGFSSCPNLVYRTTLTVKDENGKTVGGVSVATGTAAWGTTNSNGVLVKYLPAGDYTVKAEKGEQSVQKTITVKDAANVTLSFEKTGNVNTQTGILGAVNSGNYEGEIIVKQGTCGENATWALTQSGTLYISGTGAIKDEAFIGNNIIKKVVISNGITSIGNYAFYNCTNLTSVNITDVASWCEISFANAYSNPLCYAKKLYVNGELLTDLIIPDSVTGIGDYAFYNCDSLTSITIPDSVTSMGVSAFSGCRSLTSITIPDSVTSIGLGAFRNCSSLTSVTIPSSVTSIGREAFSNCDSLTSITIPDSVTSIGSHAFYNCDSLMSVTIGDSVTEFGRSAFNSCEALKTITFKGSASDIGSNVFYGVTATAYYPAGDASWTEAVRQNYGGKITWVAYQPNEGRTLKSVQRERQLARGGSTGGVFSGEYSNEGTLRTASFTDLVPGEEYLLLALADMQAEDPLAAENLLFADQATADENGKLVFTYIQRVETDTSYAMVCGASNQNLEDATITFPNMCADVNGEYKMANPEVVYNGETLVEGQDYVLLGTADYTEAGTYTCQIRGIYNYTGLVTCTYEVLPWSWTLQCDVQMGELVVPAGTVLDLNGYRLDVNSFVSYGQVVDATGTGVLSAENMEMTENASLPIYDEAKDGYRFFRYSLQNLGTKCSGNTLSFGFAIDFENADAYTLLAQGETAQTDVSVALTWGEKDYTFAFSKELVAKYVELVAKYPALRPYMKLNVAGLDSLTEGTVLTVTPAITAVGGKIHKSGDTMQYIA